MTDRAAPPPLDELLARREWVRRFARTLARDDASADDLAQEAWLAAIEHPPSHAGAPAGWFRRVLLRRAMNRSRGERRREARENAASRTGSSPPAADVVAAAESHRRVVEAVMSLDEPYRTTILLRFFEDLPPREVAARMAVPVETVRARVRRAVDKLRARLDEEHEGRRAAWLAPLLATGRGESPPSPIGPMAKGVLAMTAAKKTAAVVLALLLLGAGVAAIVRRTPAEPTDGAVRAPRDADTASTARRHPSRLDETADADRASRLVGAAPAETNRGGTAEVPRDFVVVVVDPSGHCAEGVRVGVHVKGAQSRRDTGSDFPITRSDVDGRAQFRVAGDVESAWAESTDRSEYVFSGEKVPVAPGASQIRIVVERRTWISGAVVGEDGTARARADLVVLARGRQIARVVTGDDGRFRVSVPEGGIWDVALTGIADPPPAADVPDFVGEAPGVASGAEGVRIVARPASGRATLRVRAETPEGLPLAGVSVALTTPRSRNPRGSGPVDARTEEQLAALDSFDGSAAARTDAAGRCEFANVPDRRVCVAVTTRYGEVPNWESDGWIKPWLVFVRPGPDDVVLVFRRGRAIRGRVEVPDGAPVPSAPDGKRWRAIVIVQQDGAMVSTTWGGEDGRFTAWAPADAAGPFRVSAGGWLTSDNRLFQSVTETAPAGAEDVVLRITETNR